MTGRLAALLWFALSLTVGLAAGGVLSALLALLL